MESTLSDLSAALEQFGMKPALHGDPTRRISGINTLEDAAPGELSFLSNPKYEKLLPTTRASAIVLRPGVVAPPHLDRIEVDDPYAAITVLLIRVYGYRQHRLPPPAAGGSPPVVHPTARLGEGARLYPGVTIDEDVVIGRNAVIYPGCYIGPGCRIGDELLLYPNVVIYEGTRIGSRVTIHAGTVIGEDGLGYAPYQGCWVKIPQIGIVEIGDDVEIGSNCSIDRATLGRTVIGPGAKFSNLIAVGHGTHIGAHCLLVAQVGLAGSVHVGDHVTLAGQAGVVGHIRVGNHATVGAKAGVTNNVPDGETVLGQPAIPIREMRRQVAHLMKLPELSRTVRQLEKKLAELEAQLARQDAPAPTRNA